MTTDHHPSEKILAFVACVLLAGCAGKTIATPDVLAGMDRCRVANMQVEIHFTADGSASKIHDVRCIPWGKQ